MTQMGGVHTRVPRTLTNSHPITSRADAEAYIKRLKRVETLMKQAVDRLAAQEASKIQPPRFVYALVLEPCLNLLKGAPFGGEGDSPIFADFPAKPAKAGFSETEPPELLPRGPAAPPRVSARG